LTKTNLVLPPSEKELRTLYDLFVKMSADFFAKTSADLFVKASADEKIGATMTTYRRRHISKIYINCSISVLIREKCDQHCFQ